MALSYKYSTNIFTLTYIVNTISIQILFFFHPRTGGRNVERYFTAATLKWSMHKAFLLDIQYFQLAWFVWGSVWLDFDLNVHIAVMSSISCGIHGDRHSFITCAVHLDWISIPGEPGMSHFILLLCCYYESFSIDPIRQAIGLEVAYHVIFITRVQRKIRCYLTTLHLPINTEQSG